MKPTYPIKTAHVLIGLSILAYLVIQSLGDSDFKVYLEAARLMRSGESPYDKWLYVSEGNYALYLYSPLWAMLLIPFSYLPDFIPSMIWLLASSYFLYRIWNLLSASDRGGSSKNQMILISALTLLLSFRFILYDLDMIQVTIFLLWGCLESMRLFQQARFISGSTLLAFIISIKILPIVLIPYLFYRRLLKSGVMTMLVVILFLFLPALVFGWSTNLFLLMEWWNMIDPDKSQFLAETELGPHSLTALIPPLLTETTGKIAVPRNLMDLGAETATHILNLVRLTLVLSTIYFLKWPPFVSARSQSHQLRELSMILLLIPLIFPHQQKYAFVFIIPAIYYLCHFIVFNYHTRKAVMSRIRWHILMFLMALAFLLMTLTTDGAIGRELNHLSQHYKTITWGALILIIALAIARPTRTAQTQKLSAK